MTTDAQAGMIMGMAKARWRSLEGESEEATLAFIRERLDRLGIREASTIIDRLKSVTEDPDPTMPAIVAQAHKKGFPNGREQPCHLCHNLVAKGTGFYFLIGGNWAVAHKVGECGEHVTTTATTATIQPGVYVVGDDLWRVYITNTGNKAAQKLVDGHLTYVVGGVAIAATGRPATHEEVGAVGRKYEFCMVCGRVLSDDSGDGKSMSRGYGETCANRMGWPWG